MRARQPAHRARVALDDGLGALRKLLHLSICTKAPTSAHMLQWLADASIARKRGMTSAFLSGPPPVYMQRPHEVSLHTKFPSCARIGKRGHRARVALEGCPSARWQLRHLLKHTPASSTHM